MTQKTRYFLFGAVGALLLGLGGGLVAYLAYHRNTVPAGLPPEVRYIPANAEVVAFANIQAVMNSELRRELMPTIDAGSHKGRQMMNDFAGVDLEKQVQHVVAYVEPSAPADPQTQPRSEVPRGLLLVRCSFDQARIEQFVRDRGGVMEDYNGRKIAVHRHGADEVAVGLASPELIAIGQADLVRRVIDRAQNGARSDQDITDNADMMNLIRDSANSTAWVVGQFDAVTRRMQLPSEVAAKVPAVRLVSVQANVNGGMRATIRAEAGDEVAADQLRDVVRGFISLARLQGGKDPVFENTLKSIELSGTEKTVRMSFALPPDTLRKLATHQRKGATEK
jgi:hypothetical protein